MIKSMNIAWWVKRWSELQPQKTALVFEGEAISYRALHHRANRTACWLQWLGIEKGDRVCVMLGNCPEFIEIYLACARLGALFVPFSFRLATPELDYLLKNARPRLFVVGKAYSRHLESLDLLRAIPPVLVASIGGSPEIPGVLPYELGPVEFDGEEPFLTQSLGPADPEEPHVVMYTSGTTGRPKGAVLSHRKTFFNCLNADIFFNLHHDDVMLVVLPLFHSGGLFIQASPILYKGGTIVLHPRFEASRVFEDIARHRVTKFLGVPTVYRALLEVPEASRGDISSLRVCATGGEKLTYDLLVRCRDAGFPLRQIMGQTETSILLWASEEEGLQKPGTVGRPVFHAEVTLVDRQGRPVPPGAVGEIVVRGSIMMKEYWYDPDRTGETIKNGWLRTGDLARMDEDGFFYLVDRAKDMYISGGENVYPAEVERVLQQHPQIREIAVIGVKDPTWGETGVAFVIPEEGCVLPMEEIAAFCRDRLARFKWPGRVVHCEDFPRTALGKVRKPELIRTVQGG